MPKDSDKITDQNSGLQANSLVVALTLTNPGLLKESKVTSNAGAKDSLYASNSFNPLHISADPHPKRRPWIPPKLALLDIVNLISGTGPDEGLFATS